MICDDDGKDSSEGVILEGDGGGTESSTATHCFHVCADSNQGRRFVVCCCCVGGSGGGDDVISSNRDDTLDVFFEGSSDTSSNRDDFTLSYDVLSFLEKIRSSSLSSSLNENRDAADGPL